MSKRPLHLSYSSISSFKACPMRFNNAYVKGIRKAEETESQRMGTNWHRILDIVSRAAGGVCEVCAKLPCMSPDPDCTLCAGEGFYPEDPMESVARELNRIYAKVNFDPEQAKLERTKLIYALAGYRWYYGNVKEDVLCREEHFELPLINPESGRALPNVKLVGCIDKILGHEGQPAIKEHKSTSSSIASDSTYWSHLQLDTQTTLYLYAAQRLQLAGELAGWGIKAKDPLINTILYDVWHKPTIAPKKLSQADSKKFVETGEYMGQKFKVETTYMEGPGTRLIACAVNDEIAIGEDGAKEGTFAIRETDEMYGARLLKDMTERPEFYFCCKPLNKTAKQIKAFEWELLNIYRTMQNMIKTNHWYTNEHQCEATFKCQYLEYCYNGIELTVDNVPSGMKLIFDKEG